MKPTSAFHDNKKIKKFYVDRVVAHRKADEIVHGQYWENGKGCAVGCALHSSNPYSDKVDHLGIPLMLWRLQDAIFEGMKNGDSQKFPEQFMKAIKPGADLSRVGWKFLHWLLTKSNIGNLKDPLIRDVVRQCADVLVPLTKGKQVDVGAARSARSAVWAARSAESAVESAELAARSAESAARSAVWAASAAESAVESAVWAAVSAESAARSAVWAAESAESAARSAAESAQGAGAYKKMRNKLLELLKAAK